MPEGIGEIVSNLDHIPDFSNMDSEGEKLERKKQGNFIIDTFRICGDMERSSESFVKGAKETEKVLKESWKEANLVKKDKELLLGRTHEYAAYMQAILFTANIACMVGAVALKARAGNLGNNPLLQNYTTETSSLLSDLGKAVAQHGVSITSSVVDSKTKLLESDIGEYVNRGSKLWDDATSDQKQRVDEVNALKNKMDQATQETLQKTGSAYSVAR